MVEEIKYEVKWEPVTNITVYELAKCIPYIFNKLYDIEEWENLDLSIRRHFKVKPYEYGKMIRETQSKLKEAMGKLDELFGDEE